MGWQRITGETKLFPSLLSKKRSGYRPLHGRIWPDKHLLWRAVGCFLGVGKGGAVRSTGALVRALMPKGAFLHKCRDSDSLKNHTYRGAPKTPRTSRQWHKLNNRGWVEEAKLHLEVIDWANLVRMMVKAKAMTEAPNIHNKSPGNALQGSV